MDDLVSVIVPVYNVGLYLESCVQSLLCQTYSNLEILLIDDGSTDNSVSICDQLALNDKRISVFHQQNSGVSAARNLGLQNMHGKFCCFVDSDDTVEPNFILTLYNVFSDSNVQMSCCSYSFVYQKDKCSKQVITQIHGVYDKNSSLSFMLAPFGYRGYLFNKMFLSEIIKENKLSLNTSLRMMEDLEFCVKYMTYVQSVNFIDTCLYNYLMRETSAIHTLSDAYKIEAFESIIPVVEGNFDISCLLAIRWTYYTTLVDYLQKERLKISASNYRIKLEKIASERKYFFFHQKYSVLGYIKKLLVEYYLKMLGKCKR